MVSDVSAQIEDKQFLVVRLHGKLTVCLLDTGSIHNIVSERFTKIHHLPITAEQSPTLTAVGGKPLKILGTTNFEINITGLIIPITATVVKVLTNEFIIGTNFLVENGAVVDYRSGVISLAQDTIRAPTSARLISK